MKTLLHDNDSTNELSTCYKKTRGTSTYNKSLTQNDHELKKNTITNTYQVTIKFFISQ